MNIMGPGGGQSHRGTYVSGTEMLPETVGPGPVDLILFQEKPEIKIFLSSNFLNLAINLDFFKNTMLKILAAY